MLIATAAALGAAVLATVAIAARYAQRAQRRQHRLSAAFVRAKRSWRVYSDSFGSPF